MDAANVSHTETSNLLQRQGNQGFARSSYTARPHQQARRLTMDLQKVPFSDGDYLYRTRVAGEIVGTKMACLLNWCRFKFRVEIGMASCSRRLVRHKALAVFVSGIAFLCLGTAAKHVPQKYTVRTELSAPADWEGAAKAKSLGAAVNFLPDTSTWQISWSGSNEEQVRAALSNLLQTWDILPGTATDTPHHPAHSAQLEKKEALLHELRFGAERSRRRLDAIDAAAVALRARSSAIAGHSPTATDPIGELARNLHALRDLLARIYPVNHPTLSRLSEDIAKLEAGSLSHRQLRTITQQLALFRAQQEENLARYAPTHPQVAMKTTEIEAIERQLSALLEDPVPIIPLRAEVDPAAQERAQIATQLQALADETSRLSPQWEEYVALREEVRGLRDQLRASAETAAGTQAVVSTLPPAIEVQSRARHLWLLGALTLSFCAGCTAAAGLRYRGSRLWSPDELPAGPWGNRVFVAPRLPTQQLHLATAVRTGLAAIPWAAAVPFFWTTW